MKKIFLAFLLAYPLFANLQLNADMSFRKGDNFFNKKQYDMAIFYYKKSNSVPAKLKLAKIYQYGFASIHQNRNKAIKLYLSLPDSKVKNFNLYLLFKDKGDYKKAITFLKKAAQNGLKGANYLLGNYYYNGLYSLAMNKELAIKYLKKADTSDANYIIGLYYLHKQNYPLATKYIQKAIDIDGNEDALLVYSQYNLWMYQTLTINER